MSPDDVPGGGAVTGPLPPGGWPEGFVSGPADRDALLVLAHFEGLTPRDRHSLAWREGSAAGCVRAVASGRVRGASARDRAMATGLDPGTVRAALARCGGRTAAPGDEEYPPALLDLPDPPACVFVRGAGMVPWPTSVAIVGARLCSEYGREVAEALGRELAAAGIAVVSGAALGIDAAGHLGALDGGGPTAAVLGSGIDVPHPRSNERLIERIAGAGGVLSEYPPGVQASPHRFPARNRMVAALSVGVIVVEGAPRSGSLITAEFAGDLGREVMGVPGAVTGPLSEAPHALIRDGAALIRDGGDVLEVLRRRGLPADPGPDGSEPSLGDLSSADLVGLTEDEQAVLDRIPGTPVTVDGVASAAGVSTARALRALGALELRGAVKATGGRYRRSQSPGRPS